MHHGTSLLYRPIEGMGTCSGGRSMTKMDWKKTIVQPIISIPTHPGDSGHLDETMSLHLQVPQPPPSPRSFGLWRPAHHQAFASFGTGHDGHVPELLSRQQIPPSPGWWTYHSRWWIWRRYKCYERPIHSPKGGKELEPVLEQKRGRMALGRSSREPSCLWADMDKIISLLRP